MLWNHVEKEKTVLEHTLKLKLYQRVAKLVTSGFAEECVWFAFEKLL